MKPAYIDTSLLIGIKFQEGSTDAGEAAREHRLFSSELLLAEIRAFAHREKLPQEIVDRAVEGIGWVIPDRSLAAEIQAIAQQGYVRGADLWHLACACYLSPNPGELSFLTLDHRQREMAVRLGFAAPDFELTQK